jgi:hypothetical protein
MLQAAGSLTDIFADERAPAEANFRAGNVLEALAGAVDGVRRAVKGIDRKKEGGRQLRRHGGEVRDNLVAFKAWRDTGGHVQLLPLIRHFPRLVNSLKKILYA